MNNEILEKYLVHLQARGRGKNYYKRIKIFLAYLEEKNIDYTFINQTIITDFLNSKVYNAETKNSYINAGRHFYRDFLQIPKENNEWYKLTLLKTEIKIPAYLYEEELLKGISYIITYHAPSLITPVKLRAILWFMFYSGVRISEQLSIKRADFNLQERTAIIRKTKNKEERYICYPINLKVILDQYFKSENEENNAFNITRKQIYYLFSLLTKYLQRPISPHLIRHSAGRNFRKQGVELEIVSKLLGHKNLQTTIRYTNPDFETVKNSYQDKMNKDKKYYQ
jgi:integrase/recombinase XerD